MPIATPLSRRRFGEVALGGMLLPWSAAGWGQLAPRPVGPSKPVGDGLPRALPEAMGVDSAQVLAFLDDVHGAGLELHSFMLSRGGSVVAEGWWWPYQPQRIHMLHSLTKSVMVCAVGLAIDEARFGYDDTVVSFFPEHVPADASANLKAMTVRDLLTMRTGHDHETSGSVWRPIRTSWIAEFMKIPVPYAPGTRFVYTSAASYMLSAIVTRTTGQRLVDYLRPRMLAPMGIDDLRWDVGPENINPGGNGLSWRTADSLKLGMLHAQGGMWNGRRILSKAWVDAATSEQVQRPDQEGYGYQWWMGEGRAYCGLGLFGQIAVVFPDHDAVLAIFAAVKSDNALLGHVWKHFPAAFGRPPLPASAATAALGTHERSLALLSPIPPTTSPIGAGISGKRYGLAPNDQDAQAVRFDISAGRVAFTLTDARGTHRITAGLGEWLEQDTTMTGARLHHEYEPPAMRVVAGAQWRDPATLVMTWQYVEAAFRDTVICRFEGEGVTIDRSVNLNSAETALPKLVGRQSG